DAGDGRGDLRHRHVVEENRIHPGGERLVDLRHGLALDFYAHQVMRAPTSSLDRRTNAAAGDDVVVLDQNPVVETEAAVRPTNDGDRVLVEEPPARYRLSRVDDLRFRTRD